MRDHHKNFVFLIKEVQIQAIQQFYQVFRKRLFDKVIKWKLKLRFILLCFLFRILMQKRNRNNKNIMSDIYLSIAISSQDKNSTHN